jgi:hypothetical protein
VAGQLSRIELLAVFIPLLAAIVILFLGDAASTVFKSLVGALIVLGILGFHITSAITRNLSRVLVTLTNTKV